jgi:hypothetical protein
MRPSARTMGLLFLLGGVCLAPLHAQTTVVVDAGSFTILDSSGVLGREQFSVSRAPAGAAWALEMRSDAVWGEVQWSWRLQVDSSSRPVSARREMRAAGLISARATGAQSRGRFATLARDGRREAAREFRTASRTVVLDATVVHPLQLAARLLQTDSVAIAIGLDGAPPAPLRRTSITVDTIRIGPAALPARRLDLLWRDEPMVLWVDDADRLLSVMWPQRGRRASRDDAPPAITP